ncbi:MAG: ParB/RepB/Spo0J family partition protein [Ketobacter sp.]
MTEERLEHIPLEMIGPNRFQPRMNVEGSDIDSLAESISLAGGVIQPIVVRPRGARYEIVVGERRYLACKKLHYTAIPCVVRTDISDMQSATMALEENLAREDLSSIEEARHYKHIGEHFKLTHEQIGDTFKRSRSYITNLIRLLELDPAVQDLVHAGLFSVAHARALLALPKAMQFPTAKMAMHRAWNSKKLEKQVKDIVANLKGEGQKQEEKACPDLSFLERTLSAKTCSPVEITFNERNRSGKLTFNFTNLDEVQGLIERFLGSDWEDA